MRKNQRQQTKKDVVAPGIDPDESYGENATKEEIAKGESTTVTKMVLDEYDHSE